MKIKFSLSLARLGLMKAIDAPTYAHDRSAQQRLWQISETLTG